MMPLHITFLHKLRPNRCKRHYAASAHPDMVVEDETEIMEEVHIFFKELYTHDEEISKNERERQRVLNLTTRKLSMESTTLMDRVPDMKEVEEVIKGFPKGKAPRLDGLMIEVLLGCWEWVGQTCLALVQAFLKDGILTLAAARGIIRLLPQAGALELLTNWRPITLLTLIYKILSKMIAKRMTPFMDFLVDR